MINNLDHCYIMKQAAKSIYVIGTLFLPFIAYSLGLWQIVLYPYCPAKFRDFRFTSSYSMSVVVTDIAGTSTQARF